MPQFTESSAATAPRRPVCPGVTVVDLYRPDDRAAAAILVAFEPGAGWPGEDVHTHGPEEVYVVEGEFNGLAGKGSRHHAGDFIHCDTGTSHAPSTATGGTLLVFYPAG